MQDADYGVCFSDQAMKRKSITVQCEGGLHLRIAARIVQTVQDTQAEVHLRCQDCPWANACSIMEILQLGAEQGMPLEIRVVGANEENILEELAGLLDEGAGV